MFETEIGFTKTSNFYEFTSSEQTSGLKSDKSEKLLDLEDLKSMYTILFSNKDIQGVPSIGTHFRFQFLTFLIVLSKKYT